MMPKTIANKLSMIQRNRLMEYVAGAQAIALHQQTDNSLREAGLLRPYTSAPGGNSNPRPKHLMLTELGREVVCHILGQYADALHACGLTEMVLTENQLSEAIRVSSRRITCEQIERFRADAEYAAVSVRRTPATA